MEWTDETIARLRGLWTEGHSTAEIGRRLGVSKNAVVGKAHRLDLEARPSPIRPSSGGPRPRPPARRGAGPTLPPLASTGSPFAASVRLAARPVAAPRPPVPAPAPRLQAVVPRYGRVITCCWPLGRARNQELPLLRRRVSARKALLHGSRGTGVRKSARPPRRRRLTPSPRAKTELHRNLSSSCPDLFHRHPRACSGHPRLYCRPGRRGWPEQVRP